MKGSCADRKSAIIAEKPRGELLDGDFGVGAVLKKERDIRMNAKTAKEKIAIVCVAVGMVFASVIAHAGDVFSDAKSWRRRRRGRDSVRG